MSFLPRAARPLRCGPPVHVGPSARAPPQPLPGSHSGASHPARLLLPTSRGEPAPPARTPPAPGSAATSGTGGRAGRQRPSPKTPPPSGPARSHAEAKPPTKLRCSPQPAPHSPQRRGPGSSRLRPTKAWLHPQSIHSPSRLLGTLTQPPPQSRCKGAYLCCLVRRRSRSRRLLLLPAVPALSAVTGTAPLPGAGRPASVEPNRPGRTPPAGARCICRETAAHWPGGGGACGAGPIEFRPGARRGRPGAGRGYYRSFHGAAADGTQPQPARGGEPSAGRNGTTAAGGGEPGCAAGKLAEEGRVRPGLQRRPFLEKKTPTPPPPKGLQTQLLL